MNETRSDEDGFGLVTRSTLRQFAGLCVGIFGLLFALSWYRHSGVPTVPAWISLSVAVLVGLPGLIYPDYVRPIFLSALAITQPIGHLVSIVLLALLYYGFLTPLAMLFRLTGRDVLKRRPRQVASYWEPKQAPTDLRRYLRQYQKQ